MKRFVDGSSDTANVPVMAQRLETDPLRRFIPTPYTAAIPVMGRMVRLKTNSQDVLHHMVQLFSVYSRSDNDCRDFTWKVVSEADVAMHPPWPERHAFSDEDLRFVEFGQRTFIAVDVEGREAIAFIANGLLADRVGFISPFLDSLFCMTASSLGLTSLRANCVALGRKALLVFGDPKSGKTTASYLATKLGLEFQGDDGAFIEFELGRLQAWGGFWPPVFRPDALQFHSELQGHTQPLHYCESIFHHLSGSKTEVVRKKPVIPIGCVFLERRRSASAQLSQVGPIELRALLSENVLFKEDDRFREQYSRALADLSKLPAYRFAHPSTPALVADVFKDMLQRDCLV